MQLFGRGFDRLSHVLVSENFETHPDFFYIPPQPRELEIRDRQGNFIKKVSTADAEIHLADIPFIRLRGLRSDWLDRGGYSYGRLVEQAQKDLDLSESLHDLRIDLVRRVVSVAGFSVVLSKREMFFYFLFARLCREGRGFIRPSEINVEILDETFRSITSATGGERPLAEYEWVPGYDFLIGMLNDLEHNYEVFQKTFLQIRSRINRKLSEAGIRGLYLIEARGGYSETGYGIAVAPDRVILG